MTKYDDVLAVADAYSNASGDKVKQDKLRMALENAVTSYAQAWSDDQHKEITGKVKLIKEIATNSGLYDYPMASIRDYANSTLENSKVEDIPCYIKHINKLNAKYDAREKEAHDLSEKIIKLRAEIKARNKEQNDLEEQRNHNADCVFARDKALEAARLLCANLDNGGHGHMTLVENFHNIDDKIPESETVEQNNTAIGYKYPLGTLVKFQIHKFISDDGAHVNLNGQLYVMRHTRDCDGTPLYDLGECKEFDQELLSATMGNMNSMRARIFLKGFYGMVHNVGENSLEPANLNYFGTNPK